LTTTAIFNKLITTHILASIMYCAMMTMNDFLVIFISSLYYLQA